MTYFIQPLKKREFPYLENFLIFTHRGNLLSSIFFLSFMSWRNGIIIVHVKMQTKLSRAVKYGMVKKEKFVPKFSF